MIDGKIQVKLTESAKAQLAGTEDGLPNAVPQGQTGIVALDQRAQQFNVERYLLLPDAGGGLHPDPLTGGGPLAHTYVLNGDGFDAPGSTFLARLSQ